MTAVLQPNAVLHMTRDEVLAEIKRVLPDVGAEALTYRARLQRRLNDLKWIGQSRPMEGEAASAKTPEAPREESIAPTGRSVHVTIRVPRWLQEKADAWGEAEGKNRSQVVVAALALLLDK